MLTIESLLERLTTQARQLDDLHRQRGTLMAERWFAAEVFKSKSNLAIDYVEETRRLWQQKQANSHPQVNDYLEQQISQQLMALTTALGKAPLPKAGVDQRVVKQSSLTALHKQLAQYRSYEQRLQQNVAQCQQDNDVHAAQQQAKRLNRCQQAISQLEQKIQRAEEG